MGIAIHNLSASGHGEDASLDLAAAVRQTATGLLGTTVQLADLVRAPKSVLTRYRLQYRILTGYPLCCWRVLVHWRCRRSTNVRRTCLCSDRTVHLILG